MQSKPVLILFGILILFFAYSVFGLISKMQETKQNKEIAEDRIIQLRKDKEKLLEDIQKLNTDKGKEETIRDKFGMAKDGESLIVIVDEKKEGIIPEKKTNWFKSIFKNLFQ